MTSDGTFCNLLFYMLDPVSPFPAAQFKLNI